MSPRVPRSTGVRHLSVGVAAIAPLVHNPADVRTRAEELVSRPPFTEGPPGPVRRFLRLVGDAVAGVLSEVFGGITASGVLPWAMAGLGTLLVVWLVWRITRGLTVDRTVTEVPTATRVRGADAWHADADDAEARGDLRLALRCRYAGMVATLLEGGVVEDVPGRTVRELDAEIADAAPGIVEVVAAAGRRFDAAVYGHREVTEDDLRVVRAAATAARDTVHGHARSPVRTGGPT